MQGPPYQPPPYQPPPYQQPPYQTPYQPPYQPPPPPKGGPSTGVIVAIVVAAVLGLLVVVPLLLGVMAGVAKYMELSRDGGAPAASADPLTVALDQSYTTPNKLLTAHYPGNFAAKTLDDATLVVSRNFGGGEDEVLTLAAVQSPITNDPKELARILLALVDKNVVAKGGTSAKTSERAGTCLGKYPGVEVEGTFTVPPTAPYLTKACFFIHADRGYELRYDVPRSRSATEGPLLDRVMAATEIAP